MPEMIVANADGLSDLPQGVNFPVLFVDVVLGLPDVSLGAAGDGPDEAVP